uniref:Uncharacterized protein n=1 Tax=Timema bartmani TaxID=61472 RepID=A0A7R9F0M9_9NEOP|nr:unnamed protein product [Timema bartmani]
MQDLLNRTQAKEPLNWYKTLEQYYYRDEWELFDLKKDADELHNLATVPSYQVRGLQEKNRLRKAWQTSRDPVDKANWSRKVHAVREMVKEYRNSVWEDKIESLCVQDRSLWRMTRNLMRVPAPRPPIVGRNGVANSDQEKADALAEHLEAQFVPTDDPSDPVHIGHVAQVIAAVSYRPLDKPEPTEAAEMSRALAALRLNKAPGRDGINNASPYLPPQLTVSGHPSVPPRLTLSGQSPYLPQLTVSGHLSVPPRLTLPGQSPYLPPQLTVSGHPSVPPRLTLSGQSPYLSPQLTVPGHPSVPPRLTLPGQSPYLPPQLTVPGLLKEVLSDLKKRLFDWQMVTSDPWLCAPGGVLEATGRFKKHPQCLPLHNLH